MAATKLKKYEYHLRDEEGNVTEEVVIRHEATGARDSYVQLRQHKTRGAELSELLKSHRLERVRIPAMPLKAEKEAVAPAKEATEQPAAVAATQKDDGPDLSGHTVADLRIIAAHRKIAGRSTMSKDALVEAINQ